MNLTFDHDSMASETGKRSYRTLLSNFKIGRRWISKIGTWYCLHRLADTMLMARFSEDSALTFLTHTRNITPMPKLIFPTKFDPLSLMELPCSKRRAANVDDLSPRRRMPLLKLVMRSMAPLGRLLLKTQFSKSKTGAPRI
jgi:hypothetical protein